MARGNNEKTALLPIFVCNYYLLKIDKKRERYSGDIL